MVPQSFRGWGNRKPPVGYSFDPKHPRAPDQGCWIVNEGTGLTLRDISGKAGNAALTKNAGTFAWGSSPYGAAFLCGGSSQFDFPVATIPTSAWANLGTSSIPNFTIIADIYMVSAASGSSATLLSHHTGTFGNQLYVFFDSNTLKLSFTYDATYARTYALPSGVWVRFALVKNGTNVKLYQNGVQQDSFTVGASISGDNTQAKKIFTPAEVGGLARYLVYGRALSQSDIEQDMIDPFGFINAEGIRFFSIASTVAGRLTKGPHIVRPQSRLIVPASIKLPALPQHAVPVGRHRIIVPIRPSQRVAAIILPIPPKHATPAAAPRVVAQVRPGKTPAAILLPISPKHAVPSVGPKVVPVAPRSGISRAIWLSPTAHIARQTRTAPQSVALPRERRTVPQALILSKPGKFVAPPPPKQPVAPVTSVIAPRRIPQSSPIWLTYPRPAHRTPPPSLAKSPLVVVLPLATRPNTRILTVKPGPRAHKAFRVLVVPQAARSATPTPNIILVRTAKTKPREARGPQVVSLPISNRPITRTIQARPAKRQRFTAPRTLIVQPAARRDRTQIIIGPIPTSFATAEEVLYTEVTITRAGIVIENFLVAVVQTGNVAENFEATVNRGGMAKENFIITTEG